MKIDVVFLPKDLTDWRTCAVVPWWCLMSLRATTTMTAALAAGARGIQVFPNLNDAQSAALACHDPRLLCGEVRCLPPEGFDLGNSPGAYVQKLVDQKSLFMSTTNGTRAIAAAQRREQAVRRSTCQRIRHGEQACATAGIDVTFALRRNRR